MQVHVSFAVVALAGLSLLAPACGGGEPEAEDDPRCLSLCAFDDPPVAGAGDICSQASGDACIAACGAQIADLPAVCAGCLLEDARFGTGSESNGSECSTSVTCGGDALCTDSGPGGDCDYCENDDDARLACYKQAHPRREVECKVDFRDPAECASVCSQ